MKIGRNEPCPCGSGKKYKKCCLDKNNSTSPIIPAEVSTQFEQMQAIQEQIEKQQGLGRPIVSGIFNDYRYVSSGKRTHIDKAEKWRTIHDFLFYYFEEVLGKEWGLEELAKSYEKQHPIIQWHVKVTEYVKSKRQDGLEIQSAPMTGATFALLNLSYNLFLLEHNVEIQKKLIERLKSEDKGLFQGALYESYVAAIFIRAGFKLEMENEADPTHSHCEFTAVAPISGNRYSVEAKARQPFKKHVGIGKQLGMALGKKANHKRIIFIDVNVPKLMEKMQEIDQELCHRENSQDGEWKNAPPAYVFVTNHSFAYDLESLQFERMGFAFGFKIDYFKSNTEYTSLRDARLARDKHIDMVKLIKSMREQNSIPVTFDGDIPEFAFDSNLRTKRLLIGNKYLVPDQDGKEVVGILESATVAMPENVVYGSYCLENGKRIICTTPISSEEIEAYKKHPDTFFGVPRKQGKRIEDPLELYDFFYEAYKETPCEKLLEFMKDRPDIESLKGLTEEELRIMCCEGWVYSAMQDKARKA